MNTLIKKILFVCVLCTTPISTINSQNAEWHTYTTANSGLPSDTVAAVAFDNDGNTWIATWNGLAKFDGTNWVVYDTLNSDIPSNMVNTVYADNDGTIWLGSLNEFTGTGGLTKINGVNWTTYTTQNSGLFNNNVWLISSTSNNKLWIWSFPFVIPEQFGNFQIFDGTNWITDTPDSVYEMHDMEIDDNNVGWFALGYDNGFASFNGNDWTVYNPFTSNLPGLPVTCVAVEDTNKIWLGIYSTNPNFDGLVMFDGTDFTVYNASNSDIPSSEILSLAVDSEGNKWIGTADSMLIKFDGVNSTVYTPENSDLPGGRINFIEIDNLDNKWLGIIPGITVFNDITSINSDAAEIPTEYKLFQNFPNPFNPSTKIQYSVLSAGTSLMNFVQLKVYDVLGNEVATLVNGNKPAGIYEITFNADKLPGGVYFYRLKAGKFTTTKKMVLLR